MVARRDAQIVEQGDHLGQVPMVVTNDAPSHGWGGWWRPFSHSEKLRHEALKLFALPHELHVPAVGLADEEVHVEVVEIHLTDVVVAAKELLDRVQALHPEVLVRLVCGDRFIPTSCRSPSSERGRRSTRGRRRSLVVALE